MDDDADDDNYNYGYELIDDNNDNDIIIIIIIIIKAVFMHIYLKLLWYTTTVKVVNQISYLLSTGHFLLLWCAQLDGSNSSTLYNVPGTPAL